MSQEDMINRGAIGILPRKPYWDWANAIEPEGLRVDPDQPREATFYLVSDEWVKVDGIIRKHWRDIFEQELFNWCTDEHQWPEKLSLKMFKEWFHIMAGTMLIDLLDGPIEVVEG